MNVGPILERIEGHRFSAVVNLASNLKTFLRIADDQAEVRDLDTALQQNPELTGQILQRVRELASTPAEEGLEHPADAALAVYLHLLHQRSPGVAETAAQAVLAGRSFWWARKVAERIPSAVVSQNQIPPVLPSGEEATRLAGQASHSAGGEKA